MSWLLTKSERAALRRTVKLLRLRKPAFALSVLYGVAGLGSAIGLAAVSAWLIARASQMPPVLYLTVAATSVRMFGVLRALLRYLQRLASHQVALDGMDSLRLGVYDSLTRGPLDRVASLQRGDLLSRIGADIDAVGDYVVKSLLPFTVTAIVGVGTVTGFAFLSVPAALVMACGLLVSGVLAPVLAVKSAREAEKLEQGAKRDLSVTAVHILESADERATQGQLQATFDDLGRSSERLNRARALAARPAALAAALDRLAMGLTVVGVLLVAVPQTNAGVVAAVALAVLVLTPLAAFEGTADLGPAAVQLVRSARASKRIVALLGNPEQTSIPSHSIPLEASSVVPLPSIASRELTVGWPGRESAAEGVNLELYPGAVIAIVGPSGIGKTTLLYTLAGMLKPVSGKAMINGVSSWQAQRDELTSLVTLTTEDAHVFSTTVYENLRVARADLTKEEAIYLLDEVGLLQWVQGLPSGIDTLLGVGATTISGGERRRLLLARALASPAPLLLLDEPVEHLDSAAADRTVAKLFDQRTNGRGILVATHRLSALNDADKVIWLQRSPRDGTPAVVAALGTHDQLMREHAQYRWLVEQE